MRSIKADTIGTMLQNKVHKAAGRTLPANSFEPEAPTWRKPWGKGRVRINDLRYGETYPNSFLDLYLPVEAVEAAIPVYLYAHGGGFLFAGKSSGDAIVNAGKDESSDLDAFLEELLSMGIAVASMEYAMAPEYRFPVAIRQMDEAAHFLQEHAEEYHLDKNRVILGGGSAGADMTELYAMTICSEPYAKALGIEKAALTPEQVSCIVVDESALVDTVPAEENARILTQVWLGEEDLASCEALKLAYVPAYIHDVYPPAYITCSNVEQWFYDSTKPLYDALQKIGVDSEFFYPAKEQGEFNHGFLMNFRKDEVSAACMRGLKDFVQRHL